MYLQESEDALVERAIKCDSVAFTALYDIHIDRIYNHIFYRIPSQADAEDITQEVFVKAWKAISKYRKKETPFVAWLMVIARNLIADYYKKRKNMISLDEMETSGKSFEANPTTMPEFILDRREVKDAVYKLKGDEQKVILLHFIDGFSYKEIAKLMSKSEGAVRVIQYRALNHLRHILVRSE